MDSTGRMQISVDGISEVDAILTCALSAVVSNAVTDAVIFRRFVADHVHGRGRRGDGELFREGSRASAGDPGQLRGPVSRLTVQEGGFDLLLNHTLVDDEKAFAFKNLTVAADAEFSVGTTNATVSADAGSAVACVLRLAAGIEFYTFCIRAYKRCGLPFW